MDVSNALSDTQTYFADFFDIDLDIVMVEIVTLIRSKEVDFQLFGGLMPVFGHCVINVHMCFIHGKNRIE